MNKNSNFTKICDFPNCKEEGLYRAPKDRNLKDYYWFCLKHVSEYNKSWDFYKGMTQEEIEKENKLDETWHAPCWKFGINLEKIAKEGKLQDPFEIYNTYIRNKNSSTINNTNNYRQSLLSSKEIEALNILGLKYPITEHQLKTRYKQLVKKYHPDLNNGSKKTEEIFKKVVEAYKIILKKINQ